MPRIITLTTPLSRSIIIDPIQHRVIISYALLDEQGIERETGELVMWAQMPDIPANPDGSPGAPPENWYPLAPEAAGWMQSARQYLDGVLETLIETPVGERMQAVDRGNLRPQRSKATKKDD